MAIKQSKGVLFSLVMLLLLQATACTSEHTECLKKGRTYLDNLFALAGYYEETASEFDGFINRTYYSTEKDGSTHIIAESFGFEIDDNLIDIDGDGEKELLCNCTYGANSHEELYVFKRFGDSIKIGYVDWLRLDWEDLYYWGCNAVYTRYNSKTNQLEIRYCSTDENEEHHKLRIDSFDLIEYVDWIPGEIYPTIDEELAFDMYSDV